MRPTPADTSFFIELSPSRRMLVILLMIHGGALAALYPAALPLWVKLVLSVAAVVSCWRLCRRWVFLAHPKAVTSIRWDGSGECLLLRRDNSEETGKLLPRSYVHPLLVILLLSNREGKPVHPVVIMPDMLNKHLFRRLRVKLEIAE